MAENPKDALPVTAIWPRYRQSVNQPADYFFKRKAIAGFKSSSQLALPQEVLGETG